MKQKQNGEHKQLNDEEYKILKSQIVISIWGGIRRANPYAFTEQGLVIGI
ncbi:MAG: ORF6N domain-containing protein [Elusimicrobiota bacterium]